ncbi:MAG: IMS domain-containing protein [Thermoanaerobaculia bacterium]
MKASVFIAALALALGALVTTGCSSPAEKDAVAKAEIQVFLEDFLPALGEAYAERDAYRVEAFVAQKEIARIGKRLDELSAQGQVYEPTVRSITIEAVNTWSNSNAYVTTLELWDVRRLAAGTDQVLTEVLEQPNRVKYQMKRDADGWRVLYRTIVN